MHRKMIQLAKEPITINVIGHIILSNYWELYVTTKQNELAPMFGLMDGDFSELGYVNYDEIKPYILSQTYDIEELQEILPAPGWKWVNE